MIFCLLSAHPVLSEHRSICFLSSMVRVDLFSEMARYAEQLRKSQLPLSPY